MYVWGVIFYNKISLLCYFDFFNEVLIFFKYFFGLFLPKTLCELLFLEKKLQNYNLGHKIHKKIINLLFFQCVQSFS